MTNQKTLKKREENRSVAGGWFKDTIGEARATLNDRSQNVDGILLGLIIALVVIGIVLMYSASYAYAYYNTEKNDSDFFFRNQLGYAIVGMIIMFCVSLYSPVKIRKLNLLLMGASFVMLVIVLLLPEHKGVHRWINLGFTTFQPSEIAKFAIILFCAVWADTHSKKMHSFKYGVLPFVAVLGIFGALLIAEPHISCTVLVFLMAMTVMFVGGTRMVYFVGMAIIAALGIAAIIFSGSIGYSFSRIQVWIDPFSDALGDGWQNIQALYAISSGGLFGAGLGHSRQKYLYISEPQNDFVFAVVCEELGFIGATAIIALFVAFVWRGFVVSYNHPNRFCKLLGIGITSQVGWQALLNVAVVTKVMPNTGISLPFFSYGGTSLIMLLAEMGVLLAISRGSTAKKR